MSPCSSNIETLLLKQEEKEADVKKSRQNLNTKVTPMPGFNSGQKVSKNISDKVSHYNI